MVKVSLEMKKRDLIWVSLVVVLISVGVVFAYTYDGSGDPEVMGHSADEIEGLVGGAGGALKHASSHVDGDVSAISVTLNGLSVGDIVKAELACSTVVLGTATTVKVENHIGSGSVNVLMAPNTVEWKSGSNTYYNSGGGVSVGLYEVTAAGSLGFRMLHTGDVPNGGCNLIAYTLN